MLYICQLDSARRPQGPRNRSLHYFGLRSTLSAFGYDKPTYMLHFSSRGQQSTGTECCAMLGRLLKAVKQPWPCYLLRLCQRSGGGRVGVVGCSYHMWVCVAPSESNSSNRFPQPCVLVGAAPSAHCSCLPIPPLPFPLLSSFFSIARSGCSRLCWQTPFLPELLVKAQDSIGCTRLSAKQVKCL